MSHCLPSFQPPKPKVNSIVTMLSHFPLLTVLSTLVATALTAPPVPAFSSSLSRRQDDSLCGTATRVGIIQPANDDSFTFSESADSGTIEVVYCSGQYFKTSSLDASVWLSSRNPSTNGNERDYGQLMIHNQEPDNQDSAAGYYSYRMNVTLYPGTTGFQDGDLRLSVYEQYRGKWTDHFAPKPKDSQFVQAITYLTTTSFGV